MSAGKKERMQLLLLLGIWAVGGLLALYGWVLGPALKNRSQSTGELDELNENIQKARQAMQGETKLRAEYAQALAELERAGAEHIAPPESPLSWVTEKVYAVARGLDVRIKGLSVVRSADNAWDALVKGGRVLRPYAVQILCEGSFADLTALLRGFEASNPYLCLTGIRVMGQDLDVTRHQVTLQVEWPMWGRRLELHGKTPEPAASAVPAAPEEAPPPEEGRSNE